MLSRPQLIYKAAEAIYVNVTALLGITMLQWYNTHSRKIVFVYSEL